MKAPEGKLVIAGDLDVNGEKFSGVVIAIPRDELAGMAIPMYQRCEVRPIEWRYFRDATSHPLFYRINGFRQEWASPDNTSWEYAEDPPEDGAVEITAAELPPEINP